MIQPRPDAFHHVTFAGWQVTEPVTAITDLLIALISFLCTLQLVKAKQKVKGYQSHYWTLFFLFMGLSTTAGAITHGARYYLNESSFHASFAMMNIFSGFSSLFAQLATFRYIQNNKPYWFKHLIFSLGFLFLISFLVTWKFGVTNAYATLTFLYALYVHYQNKSQHPGAGYISNGILVSFLSAIAFLFKLSISDIWFNHKDIAHVFIMISLVIMYKGARLIQQST